MHTSGMLLRPILLMTNSPPCKLDEWLMKRSEFIHKLMRFGLCNLTQLYEEIDVLEPRHYVLAFLV